ncbi:thiamine phosphate synthase, partial [Chloroflexota bacterium]
QVHGEDKGKELPTLVVANSRRVQESLRTLEELAKIPGMYPELDSEKFKHARFNLYTIEQALFSLIIRKDKIQQLKGLYIIIDTQALRGHSHIEMARRVINGGARIIQLRDKMSNKRQLLTIAQQLKELCAEHNVLFIVNDHLDIALATGADGVHVGQEDLPVKAARKLIPADTILGCSVTTVELAMAAQSEGADYLGVGAMYATSSKETVTVVGLGRLREVRQAVALPLVAIGGITMDNASEVIAAGADAVAMISAILHAGDAEETARQIIKRLEAQNEEAD